MTSEVEASLRRRDGRGRGRRGQCHGGGLAAALVFALLVLATVAAFAWAQRLKRDPLVLDRVTFVAVPRVHPQAPPVHGFTPNGDCRYDQMRIRFRVTRSDDATVQIVKPGGRVLLTLARDRFLKRYHYFTFFWDGRQPRRRHRRARPLQAAGQAARPGTQPGAAGGDPPCIGRRRAAPAPTRGLRLTASPGRSLERLPRRTPPLLAAAAACAASILLPPGRLRSPGDAESRSASSRS